MNRGYIILAVVALLLAGSTYYLLTENEDTSGETLTIWAWDPYTDVLEFAKQEYYDANPGTDIDIEIVTVNDMPAVLKGIEISVFNELQCLDIIGVLHKFIFHI